MGLTFSVLLPFASRVMRGSVILRGRNHLQLAGHELQQILGAAISMIYPEPRAALNPVVRLGEQLSEVLLRAHKQLSRQRSRETTPFLLAQVGLTRELCVDATYPHQLSGRQQQSLAIALATACNPFPVVADEPTTALDPVTQLEILSLWRFPWCSPGSLIRSSGASRPLIQQFKRCAVGPSRKVKVGGK